MVRLGKGCSLFHLFPALTALLGDYAPVRRAQTDHNTDARAAPHAFGRPVCPRADYRAAMVIGIVVWALWPNESIRITFML